MNRLRPLALLALMLVLPLAAAQTISPTFIQFDPARTLAGQTTLTNDTATPKTFAVRALRWSSANGQSVLSPAREVLLSPSRFTLAPGAAQVVRIGIRSRVEGREATYRLLIEEQPREKPAAPASEAGGVVVNLQQINTYSIPVYVTPAGSRAALNYKVQLEGADLLITVSNTGTRHQLLNQVEVVAGARRSALPTAVALGGASHIWRLSGWGSETGRLTLAFTDRAGQRVSVNVAP